jgi:hypothetical protein
MVLANSQAVAPKGHSADRDHRVRRDSGKKKAGAAIGRAAGSLRAGINPDDANRDSA